VKCGPHDTDFVGLLWDGPAGALYVDFNRNLDLTDDAPGAYQAAYAKDRQVFHGVALQGSAEQGAIPYSTEVEFRYSPPYSKRSPFRMVWIRSAWVGVVELHGKAWRLVYADNMNGAVDHEDAFVVEESAGDDVHALHFGDRERVPEHVVLNGHRYGLSLAFESGSDGTVDVMATLVEKPCTTGQVAVAGQFVERVVLRSVEADQPDDLIVCGAGQTLTAPVGALSVEKVFLKGHVFYAGTYQMPAKYVTVAQDKPATIRIGGPLKRRIGAVQKGCALSLDYSLTAVGGERYMELYQDADSPPGFDVYKGGQKVASGSFEYG